MTTAIGQWRLERNTLWRTVDGKVHFFRHNGGWIIGSSNFPVKQKLSDAGITWESRKYHGHAMTRSDALAIAHAITGCDTRLMIPHSELSVSGTPLVLSRVSGSSRWRYYPSGTYVWIDSGIADKCRSLQGELYPTRAVALDALGELIGSPPVDNTMIRYMTAVEHNQMTNGSW